MLEALSARLAVETGVREPLDADAVAELDRGVRSVCADGDDLADTLVAADERGLRGVRPVAVLRVKVGVAHAGAVQTHEAFAGREVRGLRDRVVVDDLERGARAADDGGGLGEWDSETGGAGGGHVCVGVCVGVRGVAADDEARGVHGGAGSGDSSASAECGGGGGGECTQHGRGQGGNRESSHWFVAVYKGKCARRGPAVRLQLVFAQALATVIRTGGMASRRCIMRLEYPCHSARETSVVYISRPARAGLGRLCAAGIRWPSADCRHIPASALVPVSRRSRSAALGRIQPDRKISLPAIPHSAIGPRAMSELGVTPSAVRAYDGSIDAPAGCVRSWILSL